MIKVHFILVIVSYNIHINNNIQMSSTTQQSFPFCTRQESTLLQSCCMRLQVLFLCIWVFFLLTSRLFSFVYWTDIHFIFNCIFQLDYIHILYILFVYLFTDLQILSVTHSFLHPVRKRIAPILLMHFSVLFLCIWVFCL